MISIKLAGRSVFRRPAQNLAVIIGITLGVSLFVGIQVGSESLSTSFGALGERNLGEMDARFRPILTDFFLTEDVLNESITDIGLNQLFAQFNISIGSKHNIPVIEQLRENQTIAPYIESITERLVLSILAIDEPTGSIEVNQDLIGFHEDEQGFGEFYDANGTLLSIDELTSGEVYIGEDLAVSLFGDEDPVGRELTISSTMSSLPLFPLNLTSTLVSFNETISIKGVFVDDSRGSESGTDFVATEIKWLQEKVHSAYINAQLAQNITMRLLNPIIGYGATPVNEIRVNWIDSIDTIEEREPAFNATRDAFNEAVGTLLDQPLQDFYFAENTRTQFEENIDTFNVFFNRILTVFGSLIAFAAVLVIINIQSMALQAREKETGILRAVGSRRRQIVFINLTESLFLGIIGSFFGLFGGILYGRALVAFLSISFGFNANLIDIVIRPEILQTSFFWGIIISQITGLLPAINASRINVAAVLRGLSPPSNPKVGRNTLYLGLLLSITGIIYTLFFLETNPFTNGKEAFTFLPDAEAIYLGITLILAGPSFLFAYFGSKKIGLTAGSVLISIWAYFNIFVIFDWVENTDTGGLYYVAYIMFSLLGGSILFISVNLDTIAQFGERLTGGFVRRKDSPLRGTAMVAFRQMRNKKVRSTLTFALFATILTLNIFIGSWSYSSRYGFDQVITNFSGDQDMVIYSFEPIPKQINFPEKLIETFGDADEGLSIEHIKPFTIGRTTPAFYNTSDPLNPLSALPVTILSGNRDVMWRDASHDDWLLQFDLRDNKTGTYLETMTDRPEDPLATVEDERAWEALFAGEESEDNVPFIISTQLFDGFDFTGPRIVADQADSVYLNLTDGSLQEFKIVSIMEGNPITASLSTTTQGPPGFSMFISDEWASQLYAFQGLANTHQVFVGKSNAEEINDPGIATLLREVEFWANAQDGEFRNEVDKAYGIYGIQIYSIFEQFLEIQYRFFNFLQAYVSLGFLVGILGLLVVSQRSVAERQRQIGMLRALGFRRRDVVFSVVFELIVMGLIGFILGVINGSVLGYALTDIAGEGDAVFLFPWQLIFGYGLLTLGSAIVASIFPGIRASRIPPSDALRYTG